MLFTCVPHYFPLWTCELHSYHSLHVIVVITRCSHVYLLAFALEMCELRSYHSLHVIVVKHGIFNEKCAKNSLILDRCQKLVYKRNLA